MQYTRPNRSSQRIFVVCRVLMGKAYETKKTMHGHKEPPERHDSVYAKDGFQTHHNEFITYDPGQGGFGVRVRDCVCMSVCAGVCAGAHVRVSVSICIRVCLLACVHGWAGMWHAGVCVRVCVSVFVSAYMQVDIQRRETSGATSFRSYLLYFNSVSSPPVYPEYIVFIKLN